MSHVAENWKKLNYLNGRGYYPIYIYYGLENLTFGKFQIVNLIIE